MMPTNKLPTSFDWSQLGLDDCGLPIHLPISVNENGEGPAEGKDIHHWVCWCLNSECKLTLALKWAHDSAVSQKEVCERDVKDLDEEYWNLKDFYGI